MKRYNYIYKITNRVNGKIYIGKHSTNRINDGYMGSGVAIQQAIKKYGIHNFSKFILCFCNTEEDLNRAEINYISAYGSLNKNVGYNLTYGGDGVIPTDETRKIMSEVHKGENNSFYGKHHTESTRKKMSEAHKGIITWNKGKHISEEQRKNLMKPTLKYNWLTPTGEIVEMDIPHANRWHQDWVLIQETNNI